NEYLERFRIAILWQEFDRRQFPNLKKGFSWLPDYEPKRFRTRYLKSPQTELNWADVFGASILVQEFIARFLTDNTYRFEYGIGSFSLDVWRLREQVRKIRNPSVKDYYEHLLYVSDELCKELNRRLVQDKK